MRLAWAIAIGICAALAIIGVSDGGLSGADHPPAPPPVPVPGYELVQRIALSMAKGCGSPRAVDLSTQTQVVRELRCTAEAAGVQGQVVPLFTYVRARDPTQQTRPGFTNADRYFANHDVVVLAHTPPTPALPFLPAAPFAYAIRRACHCGTVLRPGGV